MPQPGTSGLQRSFQYDQIIEQVVKDSQKELEGGVLTKFSAAKGGTPKNVKNRNDVNDCDVIATRVAELLLPVLEQQLEKTIKVIAGSLTDNFKKELCRLQQSNLQLRYELDRQEQYSRRETVRIVGLPEEKDESVEEKVMSLFGKLDCGVQKEEISIAHRNGKVSGDPKKPRHILVRFTSRRSKAKVMAKKKCLKNDKNCQKVYINDDLTALRSKLLKKAKSSLSVERAYPTSDGHIKCLLKKKNGQEVNEVVIVDTPDDLFHLGFDRVDYAEFGLTHITFTTEDSA